MPRRPTDLEDWVGAQSPFWVKVAEMLGELDHVMIQCKPGCMIFFLVLETVFLGWVALFSLGLKSPS